MDSYEYRRRRASERSYHKRRSPSTESSSSEDRPRTSSFRRRSRSCLDVKYDHRRRYERRRTPSPSERKKHKDIKIEVKAKEKLSVLSKLGIEIKLPNSMSQEDKKKKLWGDKKYGNESLWCSANVGDDKATEKFKRLMGIRSDSKGSGVCTSGQKREEIFERLEKDYEVARQTTHTMRGIGLGFPK